MAKKNFTHQDEQCFLNRFLINSNTPGRAYRAREQKNFISLRGPSQEAIVKMSSSDDLSPFINIEPHLLSSLVPRVRFFRASYDAVTNQSLDSEVEFIFNDHFSKQDVERITSSRAGRGYGVGLKSFSFDYTGTTPATSDSIIECNLKLHFNSLDDLFAASENGIAFKDLIVPSSRELGEDQGQPGVTQYNPDYFRIKVVVGYADPVGKIWESQPESLIEQIKKMKRVFYLTIVKHDLDFKDNGTMTLNIDYHAYVEKALQEDDADVFRSLLSAEERAALDKERNNYKRVSKKPSEGEKCEDEDDEENRKKAIDSSQKSLLEIKGAIYSSLLTKLFESRAVRTASLYIYKLEEFSFENFEQFDEKGRPRFKLSGVTDENVEGKVKAIKGAIENTDLEGGFFTDSRSKDVDDIIETLKAGKSNNRYRYDFDYFFLGDLLDIALTMVQDDKSRFKNTKVLLGDAPYLDTKTGTLKYVNMRDIPVSMNVYATWFLDSVVRTGQRDTYPINDFMRDIFNNLVAPVLVPKNCSDNKKNRCGDEGIVRPTFSSEVFEIPMVPGLSDLCSITSTDMSIKNGTVFLKDLANIPEPSAISRNATYIYYYARSNAETVFPPQQGELREVADNERGIYHFRAARDRGLVKSIKFKKQDQKYLKEARMVKDGATSTGIFRERYNASIIMNGFPILRPGMLAYIPPDSFGIGSSTMASELGIGGYYSIIKVLNRIDGKFETEIECSWQSNGEGKQDEACCGPKEDPCDQKVEKPKPPIDKPNETKIAGTKAVVRTPAFNPYAAPVPGRGQGPR